MATMSREAAMRAISRVTTRFSWPSLRPLPTNPAVYIILAVILIVQFFPLAWALLTSLMTQQETTTVPATLLPAHPVIASYSAALQGDIGHYFSNSSVAATVATLVTMALSTLAAYAFARLRFRFKTTLLLVVLSLSLFPPQVQIIPIYQLLLKLHLIGTLSGLILPYSVLGLPLAVLILIAVFQDIPVELEEAAVVDGLSRLGAFLRIILPVSLPGLFTAAVVVFVGDWNEYLFALNYTTPNTYTIPVGIVTISQTQFTTHFDILSAATLISVVPLVIRIMMMERRMVSGLTAGALGG